MMDVKAFKPIRMFRFEDVIRDGNPVIWFNTVGEQFDLHTHDYFEFTFITQGQALHMVNDFSHILKRGSLIFMRPDDVHCFTSYKSPNFVFYTVRFSVDHFDQLNRYYHNQADTLLSTSYPKHIVLDDVHIRLLDDALSGLMIEKPGAKSDLTLSGITAMVVYLMLTRDGIRKQSCIPDWMIQLMEEMEKEDNYIEGLPRMLQIANHSQEYINRAFRCHLNKTPTQYINELRLGHAHILLLKTDMPVSMVCERSGFMNLSYFHRKYKACYGVSPGEDRNTAGNEV